MSIYGEYRAAGAIEPTADAVTGKPLPPNFEKGRTISESVGGVFFVRYAGENQRLVTDELRKQWAKGAPKAGSLKPESEG